MGQGVRLLGARKATGSRHPIAPIFLGEKMLYHMMFFFVGAAAMYFLKPKLDKELKKLKDWWSKD